MYLEIFNFKKINAVCNTDRRLGLTASDYIKEVPSNCFSNATFKNNIQEFLDTFIRFLFLPKIKLLKKSSVCGENEIETEKNDIETIFKDVREFLGFLLHFFYDS